MSAAAYPPSKNRIHILENDGGVVYIVNWPASSSNMMHKITQHALIVYCHRVTYRQQLGLFSITKIDFKPKSLFSSRYIFSFYHKAALCIIIRQRLCPLLYTCRWFLSMNRRRIRMFLIQITWQDRCGNRHCSAVKSKEKVFFSLFFTNKQNSKKWKIHIQKGGVTYNNNSRKSENRSTYTGDPTYFGDKGNRVVSLKSSVDS